MNKHWLQRKLPLTIAFAVIVGFLVGLLLLAPILTNTATAYNDGSVYENTDVDYSVPSPSLEQVEDMRALPYVDKVVPYYYGTFKIAKSGVILESSQSIMLVDSFEDLNVTPFSKNRLLSGQIDGGEDSIAIDFLFSKAHNIKVGDKLTIYIGGSTVDCRVTAICETNTLKEKGSLLLQYIGAQKAAIDAVASKMIYSGAYIKASDRASCAAYLSNYKPMGRLRDRSEFETDAAYQIHVDAFNSASYKQEIVDYKENAVSTMQKAAEVKKTSIIYVIISVVLFLLAGLMVNLLPLVSAKEKAFIQKVVHLGIKRQKVVANYSFWALCDYLLLLVGLIIASVIIMLTAEVYMPMSITRTYLLYLFIGWLLSAIVTTIVSACIVTSQTKNASNCNQTNNKQG